MKVRNCDIYSFLDLVKNKCLVCFGCGKVLDDFIVKYAELKIENYISYIADSNSNKWGNYQKVADREIPIIAPEIIQTLDYVVVLISASNIESILTQLYSYPKLDQMPCYVCRYIISVTNVIEDERRYYPDSFRRTKEALIPKKIHYCWFGRGAIPEQNQKWMESWKKYCPDYEIIRWDEDNYDITKNRFMYEAYQAEKWGFVPDYARLDIIYNEGGVYLDTDVELIGNLDDLLYQPAFAGVDTNKWVSLGLGFGATQHCAIIKELQDLYLPLKFCNEDGSFNMVSAPALQEEFFSERGYIRNGEYQLIGDMTIYPEKVLSAKDTITGGILPSSHSLSIHHFDGSWRTLEQNRYKNHRWELFRQVNEGKTIEGDE